MKITGLLCFAILLLCSACSKGPDIAGSGSESSNALTGTALVNQNPQGASLYTPSAGASIYLYSIKTDLLDSGKVDYTWTLKDSTLSDSKGDFRIDSMKPGYYSLIFQCSNKKGFSGYFNYTADDTLLQLGYVELKNTQNIQGKIRDTTKQPGVKRWVLDLVGTPYIDTVELDGRFNFTDVPIGYYNFKIGASIQDTGYTIPYFTLVTNLNALTVVDRYDTVYFIWAADSLAVNNPGSTITIPWQTNAKTNDMSFGPDTTKLNIDNYSIEYTTTQNP